MSGSKGAGLRGLARGGLLSLAGSGVSAISQVLVTLVVTHAVHKGTAGTFFALTSVFLIAEMVARLGTGTGLVWAIARTRKAGAAGRIPAFLQVALTPVVALSVALAIALLVDAPGLARLLGGTDPDAAATAIRVLAVLLPLTTVSDTLMAATRGYDTVLPTVALDRVGRPLVQLGAVAVVATGGSVAAMANAWAAPWILSAALAAWWLVRLHRRAEGTVSPDPVTAERPWQEFWSFTGPRAVASVVQLALQRLDIVLITLLAGPAQAAVYTAATRFLVVGQFANQALANVAEPRLSGSLSVADRSAASTVYGVTTGWLILLCWPMYLLVATYANPFLDLFGQGYRTGAPVIVVLAASMLVASAIGMVSTVLIMSGKTSWNLANSVLALAVNVGLDLVLIPRIGLLGAAAGWAIAILVANLTPLYQIWRHLRLHPFGHGTLTAMGLAAACFGVLPLVARALAGEDPTAMLVTTGLGAGLYVCGCWRWRALLALDALRVRPHQLLPRQISARLVRPPNS